jgi:hypothetical protein
MMRIAWSMPKKNITITKIASGYQQSGRFEGETLFWRRTNPNWLIAHFADRSCGLYSAR